LQPAHRPSPRQRRRKRDNIEHRGLGLALRTLGLGHTLVGHTLAHHIAYFWAGLCKLSPSLKDEPDRRIAAALSWV